VSIVTPAYNAEKYIRDAIDSVLRQTYPHWELLIIDDGSEDRTADIVNQFDDSRLRLFRQSNQGVSNARNKGLDVAKGKYITFLDADDRLPPRSLEARIEFLETHPEIDLVDGTVEVKDRDLGETVRRYIPYYRGPLLPKLLELDDRVFFNVCYLFRRELTQEIRFREGMSHAEDLLYYILMAVRNRLIYGHVEETVYHYRSGNASAMGDLDGLERGYRLLLDLLRDEKAVPKKQRGKLGRKFAKILLLSRLRTGDPLGAMRALRLLCAA
jgi:glycosyltransferase involved in cell wall biosynthesis